MTNPTIYSGTIGAEVTIATGTDLVTGVASVTIAVRVPIGTTVEWTPDSVDALGAIVYTTKAGDIDAPGPYVLQPIVTYDNGEVWPLAPVAWTIAARFEVA